MDPYSVFGTPAVGVVYQLIVDLARSVTSRWFGGQKKEQVPAPDDANILRGELAPLWMNLHSGLAPVQAIAAELDLLETEGYMTSPEQIRVDDQRLLTILTRLRGNLEELFGQHITFKGDESRPASGVKVRVDQSFEEIGDNVEATAVKGNVTGSGITVSQRVGKAYGSAKIIGIDGEEN